MAIAGLSIASHLLHIISCKPSVHTEPLFMPTFIVVRNFGDYGEVVNAFHAADLQEAEIKKDQYVAKKDPGLARYYHVEASEFENQLYFPRMARPMNGYSSYVNMQGPGPLYIMAENAQPTLPHNEHSLSASLNQLSVMVNDLIDIFRSVEPDQQNMNTYGHRARNLLLIASMEFENECKGVMEANNYRPPGRWNTTDFVRVCGPLRLEEYQVRLSFYPGIGERSPLRGWNANAPTQTLPWYDAYNAVKHDRENQFTRATVGTALDAVISCAIILTAQYRSINNWKDQIGGFFQFLSHPDWPPARRYTRMRDGGDWQPMYYNF